MKTKILLPALLTVLACSSPKSETSTPTSDTSSLPVVVLTSPAVGTHSNTTALTAGGTCSIADGSVTISGSGLQSPVTAPCTAGVFSATVNLTITDGTKTVTVSQTNAAGTTTNSYNVVRDCPENYALIPANATLGTADFCLAKYEMKVKTNADVAVADGYNSSVALDVTQYIPDSRPDGVPWVRITQSHAITECASLGTGFHLVTMKEWGAMARNVESVATNWSSNLVGTGSMVSGHSDGAISGTAIADGYAVTGSSLLSAGTGTDAYLGTGNSVSEAWGSGKEQRRTFDLSNGEVIWDTAGNAREFADIDGLGGTISYTGPAGSNFYEVFSAETTSFLSSITISGAPSFAASWIQPATAGMTHATNNVGQFYIQGGVRSGKVSTRGGNFALSNNPGVFAADFDADNSTTGSSAGFRCAKTP